MQLVDEVTLWSLNLLQSFNSKVVDEAFNHELKHRERVYHTWVCLVYLADLCQVWTLRQERCSLAQRVPLNVVQLLFQVC